MPHTVPTAIPAPDVFVLPADATPRERGRAHGERFADAIRECALVRSRLAILNGAFETLAEVWRAAQAHVEPLRAWDLDLHDELVGIAEGAERPLHEIVALNQYTDLRDLPRDPWADAAAPHADTDAEASPDADDGGCTVLYAPAGVETAPLVGMTWDTHASATRFVLALGIPAHEDRHGVVRPAAWTLSIVGCVGMAGVNAHGLSVVLNNLKAADAEVGIVWPAAVRRMLAERSVAGARAVFEDTPSGSGRHYLVADAHDVWAVETSARRQATVHSDPQSPFFHTNHCLDESVAEVSVVKPTSTTWARLETMRRAHEAEPPTTELAGTWARLRAVSYGGDTARDDVIATCAGFVCELGAGTSWVGRGPMGPEPHLVLGFDDDDRPTFAPATAP